MTVQKDEQFTKRVEFAAKDDDEQIAAGVVMVPKAVDLQQDFVREDTIHEFADQFEAFLEAGEASGGVMHAVFPDEHVSLERNEVLDEPTEIGGATVEAGAWVQEWRFEDAELWELVSDGILEGYSIGAIDVKWAGPYDQDDLDDEIRVPDEIPDDAPVWELVSGLIREVSAVDIPAVPDALILETKAHADKRLADHLGNRDGFISEAVERGHSEEEAARLWEYLNRAVGIEGAGEPGKQSMFARAGKAFLSALTGSDDDSTSKTSEAPGTTATKEGRTLSTANRHSLFATIDSTLDVLEDAGVDHGMTRFTDREDVDFTLDEHSSRDWDTGDDGVPGVHQSKDMTDDAFDDAPEWAKELREQQKENSERLEEIEAGKDASAEEDETPEWVKSLQEQQEKNAERIEELAGAAGKSQQLDGGEEQKDGGTSKADIFGLN